MQTTRHTTVIGAKKHQHPVLKRALAGVAIALLLFNVPLPAFAETVEQQSNPTTNQSQTDAAPASDTQPLLSLSSGNNSNGSTQQIENNIDGTAKSGDATVADNKKAGSATSGDASASTTVVNAANSNLGGNGNFNFYSRDITGDSNENIIIDPNALVQAGTVNTNQSGGNLQTNVSLTDILNNITLSAQSGDATVSGNKKAGDATTGDASALANIINIVGSSISANNSFLGVINIYGNLKGDILVPKSFVDSLVGDGSSLGMPSASGTSTTTINNNITANASSGDATVSGNKKAGDATTGDATSSITVFNLTGQQVVAKNSLLVFVNVLGKWVGMIVPAPGSNSAMLGGGVSQSSQNDSGSNASSDTTTHITNNISVNAQSGDATVSGNKKAGDATTGDAKAGVSLVNITNSNFNLSDWFGALFINVLGSWVGDFGIKDDTPIVNQPGETAQPPEDVQIFRFDSEAEVAPVSADQTEDDSRDYNITLASNITEQGKTEGHVLGSSTTSDNNFPDSSAVKHSVSIDLVALAAIIGALTLLIALGSLALRRRLAPVTSNSAS